MVSEPKMTAIERCIREYEHKMAFNKPDPSNTAVTNAARKELAALMKCREACRNSPHCVRMIGCKTCEANEVAKKAGL